MVHANVWDAGDCAGKCSPLEADRLATSSILPSLKVVSNCAVWLGHNADCRHEVAL